MVFAILRQTAVSVLEPRAFSAVSRVVLQCAIAEMATIAIVSGGLRRSGTGQTTVTVESDKGFGKHNQTLAGRRKSSLKGRQKPCG